ncbi:MAG: 1-acyl-sn-glycerol-3-phosphate acyltransferase [Nitriliruptoraceae bacterium]
MTTRDRRPGARPPWAWRLAVRGVLWFLRRVLGWRIQARRPEVLPERGQPLVVVFNHTSNVDAFLVAHTLWRRLGRWVQPLVKAELYEVPIIGALVRNGGAIPVTRTEGGGRLAAYAAAVDRLRGGATILLAPEATITHDGSLLPLRHGAARLALEAGADVLVVTHFGAQRGFSPVVRFAERGAVVTMALDVVTPLLDEDATSLTGRIAATMIDRSEELRAGYPEPDPSARWWPPYATPASPTATARENLEHYQASMIEAIAQARERMARLAADRELPERVAQARERAVSKAEDLAVRSRARAETLTESARHRMDEAAEQGRVRWEEAGEQARVRWEEAAEQARDRAASVGGRRASTPDEPEQRDGS